MKIAQAGAKGGAVNDGLIALTAIKHGAPLASLDNRAMSTNLVLGAPVETVG